MNRSYNSMMTKEYVVDYLEKFLRCETKNPCGGKPCDKVATCQECENCVDRDKLVSVLISAWKYLITSKPKDKMEKLREFLIEDGYKGMQTFNTRNIAGDYMETVYCEDGITVDECPSWHYLEIFGLTKEEYESLSDILDIC